MMRNSKLHNEIDKFAYAEISRLNVYLQVHNKSVR